MNILMVNLGKQYGGAEKLIETLYKNSTTKHTIFTAGLINSKFEKNILNEDHSRYLGLSNSKKNFFKIYKELKKYIICKDIEIIHCHGVLAELIGVILSKRLNRKVVTTIHSRLDFDIKNKNKLKFYSLIQFKLYKYNENYIVVSESIKNYLEEKIGSHFNGHIIYNGIKELEKRNVNLDEEIFTIASIGRLTKVKGLENLLIAMKILNDEGKRVRLLVVGEGEEKDSIKKFSEINNLNVDICGFVDDVRDVLDKSNLVVMSSYMEGIPIILLEAMSYKKCIATNLVGGISEVINENNAFIFKSNKGEDIANRIRYILENKYEMEKKISAAYLEYREKYSEDIFVNKHFRFYDQIGRVKGVRGCL